jgi:poly-gamma-glutamate capsule biosynthesis protein CapA/YwtB (metallophosphatase superfamily)
VADVMDRLGTTYPWSGVAPTLKAADIAFGNLECSISTRGTAIAGKEYTFRGSPARLAEIVRYAGLDVLNLANNHVGDYGPAALADTIRAVRRSGALAVGAGDDAADAAAPRIVTRLGLRVAFVGFSDINPAGFGAGPSSPGTQFATPEAIAASVRAARRRADVVVATFHWGIEREPREDARQRAFAGAALAAGASAVIGGHPHVLQPIRPAGAHGLVAYSLGNFVWSAGSAASASTGILHVRLSTRGVERHRLQRATIVGSRPQLLG